MSIEKPKTEKIETIEKPETKEKDLMKKRLLLLQKFFIEKTDEEHQTDTIKLMAYLEEQNIPTNRKTLRSDINLLTEAGMDIITTPSKPNKYYLGEREFELPELKLLVDAVSSSRFITQKKSNQLIEKLTAMASISHREEMKRNVYPTSRAKSTNETSFYVVDTINEAINSHKKIAFRYFEYDVEKKKVFRHGGDLYEISPYALIWNEDFYYVLGYSEYYEKVVTFRVDRIRDAAVLDDRAKAKPKGFKIEDYAKKTFEMYDGEEETVRLLCDAELMKYVVDRFGEGVRTAISNENPNAFIATVDIALSPTFYAWVFQFGGGIKILSPKKAVEDIHLMAEAVMSEN